MTGLIDSAQSIFVAGHRGMVGSALCRALRGAGHDRLITRDRAALDLADRAAVDAFFAAERPDHVVLAAARVGGILANDTRRAEFIHDNLAIQTNVIDAAYRAGVKRLMFLASSAIYPRDAAQPMREDALLTGPLEPTHLPYSVAKIAGHVMCDSYRRQYGFDAFTVVPCNLYGIGDRFDPRASHVAAGLMRRLHEAKLAGAPRVTAWGTGTPLREMLFCDDLAEACLHLLAHHDGGGLINAGSGREYSIRQIAETVREVTGFAGELVWDDSRPDGPPRKVMDNSRLFATGWRPRTDLGDGLARMYRWFLDHVAGDDGGTEGRNR